MVTLEFRVRLDLGASLVSPDYLVQMDLLDQRVTADLTEIQDLRVLAQRDRKEYRDHKDHWDHQG